MNKGVVSAIGAYLIWGVFPIYWKLLQEVPALEILSHRIVWSLVFVLALLAVRGELNGLRAAFRDRKTLLIYLAAGSLLSVNWLTYIWGVNAGYIVETSLGYFINPLVNVSIAVLVLREKLRLAQWVPLGLAAAGVLYLTISYGRLPWIALTLAFSFAIYGLIKRSATLSSGHGLALETAMVFIPAFGFLLYREVAVGGAFGHISGLTTLLLVVSGVVTALPLMMFATAARSIPFTLLGLLQYLAPTIQFLIGVLVYHEIFDRGRMIGFGLIWAALAIYTLEGLYHRRVLNQTAVPAGVKS